MTYVNSNTEGNIRKEIKIVYIDFNNIHSFRHPVKVGKVSPEIGS